MIRVGRGRSVWWAIFWMALAVMFAMICSFILSRTLVPTMAKYMLKEHHVAAA